MRKMFLIVAGAVMASALMFGCSGNSQQTEKQEAAPAATESQSDGKLTDEEKSQIAAYMQSAEFEGLRSAIDDFSARFIDAAEAKDVDTIDEIFFELNDAEAAIDNLDVPAICETMDYNYRQAARCYAVAAGDFSSYLHGSAGDEVLDEASEYIEMGNKFLNDMTEETNRLAKLAE